MLVPPEPLLKGEQELMKPTDSRVGDAAKFPRPGLSQLGHSMTLFPSLLNGRGAEPTDNEVSEVCRPINFEGLAGCLTL